MLDFKYLLECLDKYCNFENLTENNFYDAVACPLKENATDLPEWTWDTGISKGVLIFKGCDKVVKIPFSGYDDEDGYDPEHYVGPEGSYHCIDSARWERTHTPSNWQFVEESGGGYCEFNGAETPDSEYDWNYCEAEAYVYHRAKAKNVDKCFAATEFLGWAKDHPIYTQERCVIFSSDESSSYHEKHESRTQEDYNKLSELRRKIDFYDTDADWLLDFLIYWGEEILTKFAEFAFDCNINDLHNGNIGYRNGVPVLVDYSSYRG